MKVLIKIFTFFIFLLFLSKVDSKFNEQTDTPKFRCSSSFGLSITPKSPYSHMLKNCKMPSKGMCSIKPQFGTDQFSDVSPPFQTVLELNGSPIFRFTTVQDLKSLGKYIYEICSNHLTCLIEPHRPGRPGSIFIYDGKTDSRLRTDIPSNKKINELTTQLKKANACAEINEVENGVLSDQNTGSVIND